MSLIEIKGLSNYLGGQYVHQDLDLDVEEKEIVGIVGGSGSGKTTLIRSILMLLKPTSGSVKVFGSEIVGCSKKQASLIQKRWGVAFQQNALFSSLTVHENVMFPMQQFTKISKKLMKEIALLKISMAGLPIDAAAKYPAELSGGMLKRAAVARAIALDPELLFLDEPTAGLDPQSAGALDELILHLKKALGLTIVIITHDLDSLWTVTDNVAFLGRGKVLAKAPMKSLTKHDDPMIRDYFAGPRATRFTEIENG